jgi:hypothetical protein
MDKTEKKFYPFELEACLPRNFNADEQNLWLFNTRYGIKFFSGPAEIDLVSAFNADIFDAEAAKKEIKGIEIVNQNGGGGRATVDVPLDHLQLWQVVQILSECNKSEYLGFEHIQSFTLTHFYRRTDGQITDRQLYGDAEVFNEARGVVKKKTFHLCANLPHLNPMLGIGDFPLVRLVSSRIELPVAMSLGQADNLFVRR